MMRGIRNAVLTSVWRQIVKDDDAWVLAVPSRQYGRLTFGFDVLPLQQACSAGRPK